MRTLIEIQRREPVPTVGQMWPVARPGHTPMSVRRHMIARMTRKRALRKPHPLMAAYLQVRDFLPV